MSKKKTLTFSQQLASIPMRNEGVKATPSADSKSLAIEVVLDCKRLIPRLGRLFDPKHSRLYVLDEIGKNVYESIDGKKSFEQLIDGFAAVHRLTFFESRALLMQYMEMLMRRGIVVVSVNQSEP